MNLTKKLLNSNQAWQSMIGTNKLENVMKQFWLSEKANEQVNLNIVQSQKAELTFLKRKIFGLLCLLIFI
jgi:hypothetical protein